MKKGKTISFGDSKKFNEHSKLNLLGYKVGRGGLPPSKRHDILRFALKSGYMELYEIKEHIEFLIDYNGKRDNMDKAIDDWKSDLEYINKI